ncbi:MAG: class I SAM-dependent methyltransferase [Candidatus Omnitrophica bacterium]|nr:class I SAM-dependent methyltransferase [Candidatus Omnitrophota bacterium]
MNLYLESKLYSSYADFNRELRLRKARMVIAILNANIDLAKCNVLDIGTGSGFLAWEISKISRSVVSINISDERIVKDGYKFIIVSDERLPFKDFSFDVVISNHTIEHLPNQKLHLNEIHRVLKENGLLYLATPNKYTITDPHYKIPFLGYLPYSLKKFIIRRFKNKEFDTYPLGYKDIKKLINGKFDLQDFTLRVVKNPYRYELDVLPILKPLLLMTPEVILRIVFFFMPSIIVLLKKKRCDDRKI